MDGVGSVVDERQVEQVEIRDFRMQKQVGSGTWYKQKGRSDETRLWLGLA